MQKLTILGATGSIGVSTLDVVARHPDRFQIYALSGHSRVVELAEQCLTYKPRYAVVADQSSAQQLQQLLRPGSPETEVLYGVEGLCYIASAPEVDTVMAAIVGAAGLLPTLEAARAGKKVLLANKESLVMAGRLFMDAVREAGAILLPIDSEHNAIFQCLPSGYSPDHRAGVQKVLLTASGGPFRTTPLEALSAISPEQACAHPNWDMGRKISVDSATMMNKGLELIEACWLFDLSPSQIEVVIHPQSVIHSMVEYVDGSVLAQLGNPDMRTPIAHALAYPQRIDAGVTPLDFSQLADFTFTKPDFARYPNLQLAIAACNAGQGATTTVNAANEIAVQAFLQGQIGFTDIYRINAQTLDTTVDVNVHTLDEILECDRLARLQATQLIAKVVR